MAKFCIQCGKELTEDMIFCTNCGTKVYVEPKVEEVTPVVVEEVAQAVVEEQPAAEEVAQPVVEEVVQPVAPQPVPESQPAPAPQPVPAYVREPLPTPPPAYVQQPVQAKPVQQPVQPQQVQQDKTNKIVGTGTFFWFKLLYAIPVVGFILSIIFSFAPKSKSLKNYSRATLIWYLIGIIFVAIIVLVMVLAFGSAVNSYSSVDPFAYSSSSYYY